jgi:hypothetical protein
MKNDQAIVTLERCGTDLQLLCPSMKVATDLLTLLSKCQQLERDWDAYREDRDSPAVYLRKTITMKLEPANLTPVLPPAPKTVRKRALPDPRSLELEWRQ